MAGTLSRTPCGALAERKDHLHLLCPRLALNYNLERISLSAYHWSALRELGQVSLENGHGLAWSVYVCSVCVLWMCVVEMISE